MVLGREIRVGRCRCHSGTPRCSAHAHLLVAELARLVTCGLDYPVDDARLPRRQVTPGRLYQSGHVRPLTSFSRVHLTRLHPSRLPLAPISHPWASAAGAEGIWGVPSRMSGNLNVAAVVLRVRAVMSASS